MTDTLRFFRRWSPLLVLVPLIPMWSMGWSRDDWLLSWSVADPATATAGAGGVFERPVAAAIWRMALGCGESALLAMHALTALAWISMAAGIVRWCGSHRRDSVFIVLGILFVASHASLAETRLWAAASNAVWASALAVWGCWWFGKGTGIKVRAWGIFVLMLGVLCRADALLWMLLPLSLHWSGFSARRRWVAATLLLILGSAVFVWMVVLSRGGLWDPAVGGELARRIFVPWGAALPRTPAAVLGIVVPPVLLLVAGREVLTRPRVAAAAWAMAATIVAGQFSGWTAAGRYLLAAIALIGVALPEIAADMVRARERLLVAVLALVVIAHLASSLFGGTTDALLRGSRLEMEFASAVRGCDGESIEVVAPPRLGWSRGTQDYENVASSVARRRVDVRFVDDEEPRQDGVPRLRFETDRFVPVPR